MKPTISYANYKLAQNKLTVKEYIDRLGDEFVLKSAGMYGSSSMTKEELSIVLTHVSKIDSIRYDDIAQEYKLMSVLVQGYLDELKVEKDEVRYIIYTKGSTVGQSVNIPYYIQDIFGFKNATVFSLEQECSSSLLAVNLANMLLQKSGEGRVIILTSNFFESFERRLMGLFTVSDAVGLIEVSMCDHGFCIGDFMSSTNGSIKTFMDFTAKNQLVVDTGFDLMKNIMKNNGYQFEDIRLFIPQNTSKVALSSYFDLMGIDKELLYSKNFGGVGHLGDVDFARNMHDIMALEKYDKDSLLFTYALGTGTSFNVLLIEYC